MVPFCFLNGDRELEERAALVTQMLEHVPRSCEEVRLYLDRRWVTAAESAVAPVQWVRWHEVDGILHLLQNLRRFVVVLVAGPYTPWPYWTIEEAVVVFAGLSRMCDRLAGTCSCLFFCGHTLTATYVQIGDSRFNFGLDKCFWAMFWNRLFPGAAGDVLCT